MIEQTTIVNEITNKIVFGFFVSDHLDRLNRRHKVF